MLTVSWPTLSSFSAHEGTAGAVKCTFLCDTVLKKTFPFPWQVLSKASVENWGKYPLNSQRPALDVWDGSSPLYPVYHTVSERWICWTRWKQSWHTHEVQYLLTNVNWTCNFNVWLSPIKGTTPDTFIRFTFSGLHLIWYYIR